MFLNLHTVNERDANYITSKNEIEKFLILHVNNVIEIFVKTIRKSFYYKFTNFSSWRVPSYQVLNDLNVEDLSQLFIRNINLSSINLSNNHFTDNEIKKFCEIWKMNKSTIFINLDNNKLTNIGYDYLKETSNTNFSIKYNYIKEIDYQKT